MAWTCETRPKFVGVVEDCFKRKSKNNNDYMKLVISDEKGFIPCMMTNGRMKTAQGWRQVNKLDDFVGGKWRHRRKRKYCCSGRPKRRGHFVRRTGYPLWIKQFI